MSTEEASVHYNEKGEVVFYDLRKPNYDDQQYYGASEPKDRYYHQYQTDAGRNTYGQGPPPPPANAARTRIIQGRRPSEETYDDEVFGSSFNTTEIRHRFVRKVYLLLFTLLGFTSVVIAVFVFEENTNRFARENIYIGIGPMLGSLVLFIILACVQDARKLFPLNMILLIIFTICSSVTYGFLAADFAPDIVLYAAVTTTGVCLLVTLVACQSWIDITGWGIYLCVIVLVFIVFGIIAGIISITMGFARIMMVVYSAIGALIISLYLMYTTQLILGGKKYEMSPEQHVLAVILLYVEIMSLFELLLDLFGSIRS